MKHRFRRFGQDLRLAVASSIQARESVQIICVNLWLNKDVSRRGSEAQRIYEVSCER